jgi:MFS family permease
MDLTPYSDWLVFLHVLGAFMFAAGHGVSMFVAFQVRKERNRERLGALVDLSAWSLALGGIGLLVLLVSGIIAGVVLDSFGKWWIWIALALLVVIGALMTPVGSKYLTGIRAALGQRTRGLKPGDPDPVPASDAELERLLVSRAPETLLWMGAGGFIVILWLMRFRPF